MMIRDGRAIRDAQGDRYNRRALELKRFTLYLLFSCCIGCATSDDGIRSVEDYKNAAREVVTTIGPDEASLLLGDDDVVFLDVREGEELSRDGHIRGAVPLPRGVMEFYIDPSSSMHMAALSSDKTVIVFCETGGRSLLATKVALDMGLSKALLLEGGFQAWREAGHPVVRPESEATER